MSDYTPTTDELRDTYVSARASGEPGSPPCGKGGERLARTEFDRWLAQHDAEVAAMALWDRDRMDRAGGDQ